ncbi:MAG: preprotein translocase subunit SecG [Lachnospiraceae bacterium]|nr:preprotein translocase subunit SecG [Lachnospiraceae bacterium]
MEALRVVVTILYCLVCLALIVVVLMQEGKAAGLSGAISGLAETYWGKNKGRSIEGVLSKVTIALSVIFVIGSVVLNLKW